MLAIFFILLYLIVFMFSVELGMVTKKCDALGNSSFWFNEIIILFYYFIETHALCNEQNSYGIIIVFEGFNKIKIIFCNLFEIWRVYILVEYLQEPLSKVTL